MQSFLVAIGNRAAIYRLPVPHDYTDTVLYAAELSAVSLSRTTSGPVVELSETDIPTSHPPRELPWAEAPGSLNAYSELRTPAESGTPITTALLQEEALRGVSAASRKWGIIDDQRTREFAYDAATDLALAYRPERGDLRAYLRAYVPRRLVDYLRTNGLPRSLHEDLSSIDDIRARVREERGITVGRDAPEVAEALGFDPQRVRTILARAAARSALTSTDDLSPDLEASGHRLDERPGAGFEEMEAFRRLVAPLTPREQSILELHYVDGLTQADIAQLFDLSAPAISLIISRAQRRLQGHLEGNISEESNTDSPRSGLAPTADFYRLLREYRSSTALESLRNVLENGVVPDFFADLLSKADQAASNIRRGLSKIKGVLHPDRLSSSTKSQLREHIRTEYPNLDHLRSWSALGRLVGVGRSSAELARLLVETHVLSPLLPEGHSISRRTGTRFLKSHIVGPDMVRLNISRYVKDNFANLDEVTDSQALATALNVPRSKRDVQQALVAGAFMSPEMPPGTTVSSRGFITAYLDPYVVGAQWAGKNLESYVESTYKNLDEVGEDEVLSTCLRCERAPRKIAAALVKAGLMSPLLPDGPILATNRASFYFDAEIVGSENVRTNVQKCVSSRFRSIDDVEEDPSLALGLGIPGSRENRVTRIQLATELVRQNYLSGVIPTGHGTIERRGSLFFDARVVGESMAFLNLKFFVHERARTLDDIMPWRETTLTLGIEQTAAAMAAYCVREKVFDWRIPAGHPLGKKGRVSFYADRTVLDQERVHANIRTHIEENFASINHVPKQRALATILQAPYGALTIREALTKIGCFSEAPSVSP